MLHATIKTNEPLLLHAYQVPFCGIMHAIYKFNMTKTIEKKKERQEGKEVVHIMLIELLWFIQEFQD